MTAATPSASDVAAYLDAQPEPARSRLAALAALLRAEAPGATERMAYAMPTWHQGENLVHLAGYARHVGLYPGPAAIEHFAAALEGFTTSKGAIQLPHDRELPLDLVRQIVRWRVAAAALRPKASRLQKSAAVTLTDPGPRSFEAELIQAPGTTACFVDFPWPLKDLYGKGNLVPIEARWDDSVTYRGSLAMMGGACAVLLCRKDVLAQLGKRPGDRVHVTVTLDLATRDVEVPEALAEALEGHAAAREAWATLSLSCRREYADWIVEAKRDETRASRVAKALPRIAGRQRLKG